MLTKVMIAFLPFLALSTSQDWEVDRTGRWTGDSCCMLSKPVEVYWSTFRLDWTVIPAAGDIIIQLQGNGTGWLFLSIETNTLSDVILGGFDASTGQPYVYVRNKVD